LPSKISRLITDGDLARLYATIYVRVASGFENKKAPSRPAWGVVENLSFSQRHDRRSTEHL
jgi:hypothetical protein